MTQSVRAPSRRLNVGCGHDVKPGFVNLDLTALPGVDVVHDLDVVPFPFEDGAFDEIECLDVLEHVQDLPAVMRELHRILTTGGRLLVEGPHFTSYTYPTDPTHRRAFASQTFSFFAGNGWHGRSYYFDFQFERVESTTIGFQYRLQPWNRIVERLVNLHVRFQDYYEATFLARLFPAHKVTVLLIK